MVQIHEEIDLVIKQANRYIEYQNKKGSKSTNPIGCTDTPISILLTIPNILCMLNKIILLSVFMNILMKN